MLLDFDDLKNGLYTQHIHTERSCFDVSELRKYLPYLTYAGVVTRF